MSAVDGVDVVVCVPYTDLRAMVDSARGSRVEVYAQNMHSAPEGAYTGEISAPMLCELDVHGVVLGHSERRQCFGETDRALQAKVPAALAAGLAPILCVGETESEREAGETQRKLRQQVRDALAAVPEERLADVAIAYEPVWAIGTGSRRHGRAGPGGDRASSARSSATATPRPPRACEFSTEGPSSPRTPPSCSRCPMSTARSSVEHRWTPTRSPRS